MGHGEVKIVLVLKNCEDHTRIGEICVRHDTPISELRKIASEKIGWENVRLRQRMGTKGLQAQMSLFVYLPLSATNVLLDGGIMKEITALKDGT